MKTKKNTFEINLLRLINSNILQIESVESYLKRDGIENRKPFSEERFMNMLKYSSFPFDDKLSYFFPPIRGNNKLRIDGGCFDPYCDTSFVIWLKIKDGYTCEDIEKELNAAIVIDFDKLRTKKQKYIADSYLVT